VKPSALSASISSLQCVAVLQAQDRNTRAYQGARQIPNNSLVLLIEPRFDLIVSDFPSWSAGRSPGVVARSRSHSPNSKREPNGLRAMDLTITQPKKGRGPLALIVHRMHGSSASHRPRFDRRVGSIRSRSMESIDRLIAITQASDRSHHHHHHPINHPTHTTGHARSRRRPTEVKGATRRSSTSQARGAGRRLRHSLVGGRLLV
jgi:hypothetical protein